jgi:hypothetical protein
MGSLPVGDLTGDIAGIGMLIVIVYFAFTK